MTDYNKDFQELFIRALITDSELFTKVQPILKDEYFEPQLRKTVSAIIEMVENYNTLPTEEQLYAKTGLEIQKIDSAFDNEQRKFYVDEIEKFCKNRALTLAVLKAADVISKDEDPGGVVEGLVKNALEVSLTKDLGIDYFEDPKGRLLSLRTKRGEISTGWDSVDKMIDKVGRGELLIFCGGRGVGKSLVMQNISINFSSQGFNVVYITLELDEELVAKRMDAMLTGIAHSSIYGRIDDVDLKVRYSAKSYGDIIVKDLRKTKKTSRDIRNYLNQLKLQKNISPDIIVVDYMGIMRPNDSRINPSDLYTCDKYISEELRDLAKEFDAIVVTGAQITRGGIEETVLGQNHISGGISKIDTADNVIFLYSTPAIKERGEIQFQFAKTRNSGGVGKNLDMAYDPDTTRITDLMDSSGQMITPQASSKSLSIMDKIKKNARSGGEDDSSTPNIGGTSIF